MPEFDPNAVAVKNGRYFGFPFSLSEAEILVLPAPWDVTTSYQDGTHRGPAAVLEASTQLDFTSPYRAGAWNTKIGTILPFTHWESENTRLRSLAKSIFQDLEQGRDASASLLEEVNAGGQKFHRELEQLTREALSAGKKVVTIGGDHSVSIGPIKAHGEKHHALSVLHIDAHADLRKAYAGFQDSHASIMHQVSRLPFVQSLVQVGLRDVSQQEMLEAADNNKITAFYEWDLRRATARGASWAEQCEKIIQPLGKDVYLSVDIDGFDPKYCPGTGTPVPGGLELWEFYFLLEEVERSGRRFVGADLVEVSPGISEWDANVGARILFQICQFLRD